MIYTFWKMHGAGNDFVLVDDRSLSFPSSDKAWLAGLAARKTGIGCDGIILIQPSLDHDFRMRFFNPDGGEAEMCGNGARCVARLAHELGAAPSSMRIETVAGTVRATVLGGEVRLDMPPPHGWRLNRPLRIDGSTWTYGFVNSGVPHAVIEVEDLDRCDVQRVGSLIRRHPEFAPAGTNANFIAPLDDHTIRIRTYERGVEAETLACGTGMVAGALIAARLGRVRPPVCVLPASGDRIKVDFNLQGEEARDVTLLGPAVHVFQGTVACPPAP